MDLCLHVTFNLCKIFLIFLIFQKNIYSKSIDTLFFYEVKKARTSNGIELIYTAKDWGQDTKVLAVFIKGGGSLKFNGKKGLSIISEAFFTEQNKILAQKYGFRFKSYLTWDYLAYLYYIPLQSEQLVTKAVIDLFLTKNKIQEADFENIKKQLLQKQKRSIIFELFTAPIINFMVDFRSIYRNDITEQIYELNNFKYTDFNTFLPFYTAPNYIVISFSNTRSINTLLKNVKNYKAIFRGDQFVEEKNIDYMEPYKNVKYIHSQKNINFLRLGYKGFTCSDKQSYILDLTTAILEDNDIKATNYCYQNIGYLELNLNSNEFINDQTVTDFNKQIMEILLNISDQDLNKAKLKLKIKFWQTYINKDNFIFLIAKTAVVTNNYLNFLNYVKKIEKITKQNINDISVNFAEQKSYKIIIKSE